LLRFLHSADWQLGMTRHFFAAGVQERFTQARFDAVRRLGDLARREGCRFITVAGDVFDSNQVDRKTVARALEALKSAPVPVYLLPGNHDPLDAASVYRSRAFVESKPDHVHVLDDGAPRRPEPGVEVVGAPWTSKRPLEDLAARAAAALAPAEPGLARILVAHGIVDSLAPDGGGPGAISQSAAEAALAAGRIQFLALGDRHSLTWVGASGRIAYPGTPEATDYDEVEPGFALVVDLDGARVEARKVPVGSWRFIERVDVRIDALADLEALREWLEGIEDKERTVVKLRLSGAPSLSLASGLDALLSRSGELLAALETRDQGLLPLPDDEDFSGLGFSGFAARAVEKLRAAAASGGEGAGAARDALALLVRLARGSA
jgi:DNA repair exonuclease SbcCD nuclease subunit